MTVATDKTRVSTYIDAELKKKAEIEAKKEGRSLSNFIEQLIKARVENKGEK
ncbi:MAG: ribbon-helix-helix protein, CopG family [Cyanobacteria bacterium P01_G01_bin.49]